ncbi:MAG: multiprotein-bridging factor 1 family protein [Burkholderiaceae bacterium]
MITAAQCRAARAMLEWSREQLAEAASLDVHTIASFENRSQQPDAATREHIERTFEENGVAFFPENADGGAGVRLKFNRKEVRAIRKWEGEGGTAADDDV